MKKTIILITTTIMILSFAACDSPAVQETPTQQTETSSPTEVPTSEPTPEPSPTPEPTKSPAQIEQEEMQALYEEMLHYYEDYGDIYAKWRIFEMYYAGEISEDMLSFCNDAIFHKYVNDWEGYSLISDEMNAFSALLNGQQQIPNEAPGKYLNDWLSDAIRDKNSIWISLLEPKEMREKTEDALKTINAFLKNPTDENRIAMEDVIFSEDLSPGCIWLLRTWLYQHPHTWDMQLEVDGKTCDFDDYDIQIIEKYGICLAERLFGYSNDGLAELNSTPNTENDWIEILPEREILSSEEITQVAALSEAEELKFYYEYYNDEYAALRLKQMYEADEISDDIYNGDIKAFAEICTQEKASRYQNAADMVNGVEGLSADDQNLGRYSLHAFFAYDRIPISLFETAAKRNQILTGIKTIDSMYDNMTDDNITAFQALMSLSDLTNGEYIFLYNYAESRLKHWFLLNNSVFISEDGEEKYFYDIEDMSLNNGQTMLEAYMEKIGAVEMGYMCYEIPELSYVGGP